jgi:hypothetical protein
MNGFDMAFPSSENMTEGLSARDYFAGQIVAGLMARPAFPLEDAIKESYVMADRMIAESQKRTS